MTNTAAGGLKELHQIHIKLKGVQDRLAQGPRQVRARRQFVERKEAELQEQKDKLQQLRMGADQKSLQLRTTEGKIAELRTRLNMASSNREYDIIRSQIDADSMANSVLEDEILEALDKVDQMQALLRKTEDELATARSEEERIRAAVGAAEPGLRQEAGELETALQSVERSLPGAILDNYRRLVHAHGAGALAAVENNACTSCNAILSPQLLVDLRTGKIVFCRSCGRLLYRSDGE